MSLQCSESKQAHMYILMLLSYIQESVLLAILQPNPMESALDPLDLQLLFDVCLTWSGDEKDCGHDQLRDRVRPPTSHGTSKVHNPTKPLGRLEHMSLCIFVHHHRSQETIS